MKIFLKIVVIVLALLAASSGIAKIMLMPQEINFFGPFGFTNHMLVGFGLIQLIAALLMLFARSRLVGAFLISLTFLISAAILFMSGNSVMTVVTLVFVVLAGTVINTQSNANNS